MIAQDTIPTRVTESLYKQPTNIVITTTRTIHDYAKFIRKGQ